MALEHVEATATVDTYRRVDGQGDGARPGSATVQVTGFAGSPTTRRTSHDHARVQFCDDPEPRGSAPVRPAELAAVSCCFSSFVRRWKWSFDIEKMSMGLALVSMVVDRW